MRGWFDRALPQPEYRHIRTYMAIQLEMAWDEFVEAQAQAVMPGQGYAAIEKLGRA